MKIKDLPKEERPREKAVRYGFNSLNNAELLAIILGSGTKEANVMQISTNLLSTIGGIKGLNNTSYYSLKRIYGIKEAKALMLASIMELYKRINISFTHDGIIEIINKYEKLLEDEKQEKVILLLSKDGINIDAEKILYIGIENKVTIAMKDIYREVFTSDTRSFYLIHTHPTSYSIPSKEDIKTTLKIQEEAKKVGLKLLDHIIIGLDGYLSINNFLFKEENSPYNT